MGFPPPKQVTPNRTRLVKLFGVVGFISGKSRDARYVYFDFKFNEIKWICTFSFELFAFFRYTHETVLRDRAHHILRDLKVCVCVWGRKAIENWNQ